jgi:hypothetical protein
VRGKLLILGKSVIRHTQLAELMMENRLLKKSALGDGEADI